MSYPAFSQKFADREAVPRQDKPKELGLWHEGWQDEARQAIYEENLAMGGKTMAEIERHEIEKALDLTA
jgi:hypothetical protein